MADALRVVDRHDAVEVTAALARHDAGLALDLLDGIVATDAREQSGIFSTASGVLAGYRTEAALAASVLPPLDVEAFVSGADTLYVCASTDAQRHAAPLVAGIVRDLRTAAYNKAATVGERSGGGPPVLLVLDELANIAPLHDLPALVAEGASQGVVTLACLQDLSQARARWGPEADGFLSLFGTKLVLPGIAETRTLEAVSLLGGDHDVATTSRTLTATRRRWRRRVAVTSRTEATRRARVLPVEVVASGVEGHAVALDGARPGFVRLTPWYSTSPWRSAVSAPPGRGAWRGRDALPPGGLEARSTPDRATGLLRPPGR